MSRIFERRLQSLCPTLYRLQREVPSRELYVLVNDDVEKEAGTVKNRWRRSLSVFSHITRFIGGRLQRTGAYTSLRFPFAFVEIKTRNRDLLPVKGTLQFANRWRLKSSEKNGIPL